MSDKYTLHHGDCLEVMAGMEANSIDTVITDPPYHLVSINQRFSTTSLDDDNKTGNDARNGAHQYARLSSGFMGKQWDGGGIAFDLATWAEVLRVAKPGAMLLAFGGTRTFHRLACAIEDAGWIIRDDIAFLMSLDEKEWSFFDSLDECQQQAFLELFASQKLLLWVYGSGFPKSHNINKVLEKKIIQEIEKQGYEFTEWIE